MPIIPLVTRQDACECLFQVVTVLALVTEAFGGRGGIAQYNRDFLRALAASPEISAITVLPRNAPDPPIAGARIIQAPPRASRLVYSIRALLTALRQRTDVVFCGHLYMAPLAWLIAQLKGAKLVIQIHGIEAWSRPSGLRRAATEAADLVLCQSRHSRARVVGWAAIAPERVVILPVTFGKGFAPGDGSATRRTLGIANKYVLLTVARMDSRERGKGQDRVIAAIPSLVSKGYDVGYLIAGEGDDRVRLEGLARQTGVAERVRFLGAVPPKHLREIYRVPDLFVMPSIQEGFGIAFLEAMASGTPALALDVAGARDALADGELGTVVSKADDFPGAIARLLDSPRSDPSALSRAVCARFGRALFRAQLAVALENLLQLP
jgi:phosphatidyl-myo-inositol dimannoside synthase